MNQTHRQQALKKLIDSCVHCSANGQQLDMHTINRSMDSELVHIRCASCQGALVALLFTTGPLINSVGLITDLSRDDVSRFQEADALTEDDLLGIHRMLTSEGLTSQLLQHY